MCVKKRNSGKINHKANEFGTYECQWNSSRGQARHRNFNVSVTFAEDQTNIYIVVSVILFVLLAFGIVINIDIHLGKVRN